MKMIVKKESIEMHITYKIFCIVAVAFSLFEVIVGIVSSYCIQNGSQERLTVAYKSRSG